MFSKTRVAVLRGGPSSEYHVSLKTGGTVLANLPEKYHGLDVLIDLDGVWHLKGRPESPESILGKVDVVWNALHGEYGEDGAVQHILEAHNVPFTGSPRLPSALAFSKGLAKQLVIGAGIQTPYYGILRREEIPSLESITEELYRTFPQPSIVKPLSRGSSIGVAVVRAPEELLFALETAFALSDAVLVEEYIEGKEACMGVIEGYRGDKHYVLVPTEIARHPEKLFFDFETKYADAPRHSCPGRFSTSEKAELQKLAKDIHKLLGLRHYSRSEFIVHPTRGIYFLEADSLPDLHENISPFLLSLNAVGGTLPHLIDHVLTLALTRN